MSEMKALKQRLRKAWSGISTLIFVAAVAFMGHGYLTSSTQHSRVITDIKMKSGVALLSINDGASYSVSLDKPKYNRKNLFLLYPGKHVWIIEGRRAIFWGGKKDACVDITPIEQENMPVLDKAGYARLVEEGFTDKEISYSFVITQGGKNPNLEPPTYGDTISYGAPGVCATRRE